MYMLSCGIIYCDNFDAFQVVIRRLPPSFTEEQLKEELGGFPEHDFFYFVGSEMRFVDCTSIFLWFFIHKTRKFETQMNKNI